MARTALARRQRLALSGSVLGLAGLLLACLSARYVGTARSTYLTYWFALISTLSWLPITGMWLAPRIERAPALLYVSAAAALGVSALASRSAIVGFRWITAGGEELSDVIAATDAVAPLVAGTNGRPPAVLSVGSDGPNHIGVVAMLRKRGIVPLLEERLQRYGGGFEYRSAREKDTENPWLVLAQAPSHEHPILASFGSLHLYWRSQGRDGVAPRPTASASGATGDPALLLGGVQPRPKKGRSGSAGALTLQDEASQAILHLGGALVGSVGLRAQGDAGYSLEASADGRTYEPVATLPPGDTPGMVTQRFALSRPGPWEALRVRAHGGDGQTGYAVAKLSTKLLGWGVRVESARGLKGDLSLVSDGVGGKRQGVVTFSEADAELMVSLPSGSRDVHLVGLRIDAQASDVYAVEGSYDGSSFEPIGVSKALRGAGMRSRLFHFNDLRAWRYVRLSPTATGKAHALGELSVLMGDGPLIDLEAPPELDASATRPLAQALRQHDLKVARQEEGLSLGVALDASRSYELLIAAAPLGRARLDVSLNGQSAETLDITASRTTYRVDVPAGALQAGRATQVVLTPASSSPGPEVRIRSLLFRALVRPKI